MRGSTRKPWPSAGPVLRIAGKVDHDIDALFLDAERGDLREAERLDPAHHAVERLRSTPGLDEHLLARHDAHGLGRKQVDHDFEPQRITHLDERRRRVDHAFALLQYAQDAAAHR